MSVYKKLMDARIRLQNTALKKTGHNKFAGYNYFELGDFLPIIQQIFSEVGLCGVVSYATDLAVLTITDIDDGSFLTITSPMAEAALKGCHPIQNLGAVETYTRRYLWVTALEIVEHEVLDPIAGGAEKKPAQSVAKDVWDNTDEATKRKLEGIAEAVRECLQTEDMTQALHIYGEVTDADEKTALWSRFDSKERSSIKKAAQQQKEQA